LNRILHGRESTRHATERRRTVDAGIKRTLSRVMVLPRLIWSLMEPMPIAQMAEPLMPFMMRLEMGRKERKSLCSGDIWVVQPLSRRKGEEDVEASWRRGFDSTGDIEMLARSTSFIQEAQSTELTNSS